MPFTSKEQSLNVIREFINTKTPSRVRATTQEIARWALSKAIILSPYDTGQFMASWIVGVAKENLTYAEPGQRSMSEAANESVEESEAGIQAIKLGVPFYLSNSVPHAPYVEYGSPTTNAHYILKSVQASVSAKFGRI